MQALHTLFTPGGGTITFGQYYFRNVFFDTVRVAILRDQPNPIKWTCGEFSCWSAVALHVVNSGVRILGCPEFQTNEHPLIRELSKIARTHHITTGCFLFVCSAMFSILRGRQGKYTATSQMVVSIGISDKFTVSPFAPQR